MKRLLTFFTLLAIAVLGTTLAQPAILPDDDRFDEPVQFVTGTAGASLRGMLQALAESVGLVPVFGDFADRTITQEIDTPTPFRQVWSLVLTLYDLEFTLQDNDVVVIGTAAAVAAVTPEPAPQITVAPEPVEEIVTRTYRINNPADAVSQQITTLVPGVSVAGLPLGNSIVVRGTEAQQERVQAVLDQYDVIAVRPTVEVAPAPPIVEVTYRINNPAPTVILQITTLVPGIDAAALPLGNSIVVRGTEAQQERVQAALDQYDVIDAPAIVETEPAVEAEPIVEVTYRINNPAPTVILQITTLVPGIDAAALPLGNSIVVRGTEAQQERVQAALDQYDVIDAPAIVETEPAVEAEPTEERTYRINNPAEVVIQQVTTLVPGVSVAALPLGNSIVVRGTEDQHVEVQAVLDQYDVVAVAPEIEAEPTKERTYRINNPAEVVIQQVTTLVPGVSVAALPLGNSIVVRGTEDQHVEVQAVLDQYDVAAVAPAEEDEPILESTYRINNPAEAVSQQLNALIPGLSIDVLPLGNSIVVRGTAAQQERVQSVLDQFDVVVTEATVEVEPVEQRTYQLSNAKAEELAAVLQSSGVVTNEEGAGTAIIEKFVVTAEPRTNSLIITATGPVQAQLAELIPSLDTPQKQVNVQLRIQEIQRRTAQNFGLDIDADFGNLSVNIMDGGLTLESIFNANPFISGLNILAVLDTLETQGLSRRVDDSNITMLNNEEGRIQSGGRIELQFAGIDGVISSRTIEFGVIITMTPRVSIDGRVILEVTAEVTDVLVPLNEGGIPQRIDFSAREVTSTVTLEPGQTVLLGGLLQNQFSRSENRIPLLGSIPFVGDLFGSTIIEDEATELLLVVNAQVIE